MRRGNRIYKRNYSGRKNHSTFFANGGESAFFPVQASLETSRPGDRFEQEADKVADAVVSQNSENRNRISAESISETISPLVQGDLEEDVAMQGQTQEEEEPVQQMKEGQPQKEEEEALQMQQEEEKETLQMLREDEEELQMQPEEEEEVMLQTKALAGRTSAQSSGGSNASLVNQLNSESGKGKKMDPQTSRNMENGFGADFSRVNIHADAKAAQLSKQLGAQAFTHGNDIYFNKGRYRPETDAGKHLLAHELTHTIQQTGRIAPQIQCTIGDGNDLESDRFMGNRTLEAVFDGERTLGFGSTGQPVSLIQQALVDAGFPLPQFGVDGIFGSETRGALIDFQRSSSLAQTGIVNSATMTSLDALYSYGQPNFPAGPPVAVTPVITAEVVKLAPGNTSLTRTTVGVGEFVRFTGNTSGTWTVSAGRIVGLNSGQNVMWEAPPVAANPQIMLTTPTGSATFTMTVIAPKSLAMTVNRHENIPAGTAGACMITDVVVHPLTVNFGRTQWLEVPGPGSMVAGYYTRFPASELVHKPNPDYLPFDDTNSGLTDHAATHAEPAPFANGMFQWEIPNRYKIDGESDGQGRFFTKTYQTFFINSNGTVAVVKAGAMVIRFVNNTVF